jgi:predicted O-methyltransferase YrrM
MSSTGKTIVHTIRYLIRLDAAATQTSPPEREMLSRFACGRRRAVEIGVFEGATTALIAKNMAPDGKLYAVDPFFSGRLGICWGKVIAKREIKRSGVGDRISLVEALSHDAAAIITENDFDFIFIDGDHSLPAIRQDWGDWSGRIVSGGVALLHDTQVPQHNPRVRELGSYQYFQETISHDPRFELLDLVDSLSVLRRL